MNEKRKGIWIPMELMMDKQLDWSNKVLLSEICSLHELPNGCTASNEHFASILGFDSSAASKRISKLKKLGYIQTKNVYNRNSCSFRIITPILNAPKKDLSEQRVKDQKCKNKVQEEIGNNNLDERGIEDQNLKPDFPKGSSQKNDTPLTVDLVGSSQTIIEVVPERQWGSSHGNIINTSISSNIKDHLLYQYTGETETSKIVDDLSISNLSKTIEPEEQIISISTYSDNSTNTESKQNLQKISTKEFRDIMNEFFDGYSSWETDLLRLGIDEFVRRTPHYHSNIPEFIDLIREFNEL